VIEMPSVAGGAALDSAATRRLGLVAGFGLPFFYLIPISFSLFNRITRERHEEIRAQPAKIRG
jgi:hypothetical protein